MKTPNWADKLFDVYCTVGIVLGLAAIAAWVIGYPAGR